MRVINRNIAIKLPTAEPGNPPVGKNGLPKESESILLATGAKLTRRRVGMSNMPRYVVRGYAYGEKDIKELGL